MSACTYTRTSSLHTDTAQDNLCYAGITQGVVKHPTMHVMTTAGVLLNASALQPLHEKPTLGPYDTVESATAVHGCSKRNTGP